MQGALRPAAGLDRQDETGGMARAQATASASAADNAATLEISRNVQPAALGTRDVSSSIVSLTQTAGKTGESATQVQEAARSLGEQADVMKNKAERLLSDSRAT